MNRYNPKIDIVSLIYKVILTMSIIVFPKKSKAFEL